MRSQTPPARRAVGRAAHERRSSARRTPDQRQAPAGRRRGLAAQRRSRPAVSRDRSKQPTRRCTGEPGAARPARRLTGGSQPRPTGDHLRPARSDLAADVDRGCSINRCSGSSAADDTRLGCGASVRPDSGPSPLDHCHPCAAAGPARAARASSRSSIRPLRPPPSWMSPPGTSRRAASLTPSALSASNPAVRIRRSLPPRRLRHRSHRTARRLAEREKPKPRATQR